VRRLLAAGLVALASCDAPAPAPPPPGITYLTPVEHLSRASLALRGVRPSLAELQAVAADPSRLPDLVDGYLDTPEFGATIRDLHAEVLLLRIQQDNYTLPPVDALEGKTFEEINASIFEQPLHLIEDIVRSDRPYTEIVTADYTMADRIVATAWGMPHGPGDDWERAAWPDGRGAAGILAENALFIRYRSLAFNYNRGRAAAISRGLLCHDFLAADVTLDTSVDLSDPAVVSRAVIANPSCAGCHQTLDPLASYFWGFRQGALGPDLIKRYPYTDLYDPTDANGWFLTTNRPPAYFGATPDGLAALGQAIAEDPRFARCAAIHFASYLTEIAPGDLAPDWIAELQADFVDADYSAKQLARAVVLSDRFRTAASSDPAIAEGVVGYQKLRPEQLQRMLADLTGFVWRSYSRDTIHGWTVGPFDYLEDDHRGFRVLAGGIDSFYVTQPVHTLTPTARLVVTRAALEAAAAVVDHDAASPAPERALFTAAGVDATDDASVRAELAVLHARIYGELVAPDAPSIDATLALYRGALRTSRGDPRRAWTATLTGMLSDLRALYY